MAVQVSERGQITIDKDARRALSVQPGMVAVQIVAGDHLEVYFVPAPHRRSLFGALPVRLDAEARKDADWAEVEARSAQTIAVEAQTNQPDAGNRS